jgi:hypothetical protein
MADVLSFDTLPLRYRTTGPPKPTYNRIFNPVLKRSHEEIELWACLALDEHDDFKVSGELTASVGGIDRELMEIYRGPILFYGDKVHLDMLSFRYIVDEMRVEYHHNYMEAETEMPGSIDGVRVNCAGDCDITGRPDYEIMKHTNEVFTIGSKFSIPVADKIGIPLHVYPIYPAITWRGRFIHGDPWSSYNDNPRIRFLKPAQVPSDGVRMPRSQGQEASTSCAYRSITQLLHRSGLLSGAAFSCAWGEEGAQGRYDTVLRSQLPGKC